MIRASKIIVGCNQCATYGLHLGLQPFTQDEGPPSVTFQWPHWESIHILSS